MSENVTWQPGQVTQADRRIITGGDGMTIWLTGLPGSGKSTIAFGVEERLIEAGRAAYVLDGDNLRHGLNADLGFSAADRTENVRRVGETALLLADAGVIALAPVVSPYRTDRLSVRRAHTRRGIRFVEVLVDTPLEVCEERDPKGLYQKAREGLIKGMTGVDDPYEPPEAPELVLRTVDLSVEEAVEALVATIVN